MALLDIQRRGQQIGRIRLGEKVDTGRKNKNGDAIFRPSRLATWRLTTGSRISADAVAGFLGGQVRPWEGQWEVVTDRTEIGVTIPPRDQVISQDYEMWSKGGCVRRCDSVTERIKNIPCPCPKDAIERSAAASANPPTACKAITRINVMIPDLPGLGVWRLDTSSFYAAVEIGDSAELMEMARNAGVFLPAVLRIDQRTRVAEGKTKHFPVPVLEVLATWRQIATGQIAAGGVANSLPPAPGESLRAITAGPQAPAAPKPAPATRVEPGEEAQAIADKAWIAQTRADVEALVTKATDALLIDDFVLVDGENEVHGSLRAHLQDRWKRLPAEAVPA